MQQPVDPVTTLDIVTLVVAISALMTSMAALAWQLFQHRLTGAVVKVDLRFGVVLPSGEVLSWPPESDLGRVLGVVSGEAGEGPQVMERIAAVRARNVGRMAVDVEACAVTLDNGMTVADKGRASVSSQTTPHRLGAGASATFLIEAKTVHMMLDMLATGVPFRSPSQLRGTVELGTGARIHSEWATIAELPGFASARSRQAVKDTDEDG